MDYNRAAMLANLTHFRWHAIPAVVVGFLLAGNPYELAVYLPKTVYLSMMMTWGPWVAPINTFYWIATPLVVIWLEIAKKRRPHFTMTLSRWQILIWWSFWLLFGMAFRCGKYDGP